MLEKINLEKVNYYSKRFLLTYGITLSYCYIWILLEKYIEGNISNSHVDNIIILLFVPIIWIATKSIVKFTKKD